MEYNWEISRAMRDIAYLEDYVYDGEVLKNVSFEVRNPEVDWEEYSLFRAYKLKGKILLAFNNMSKINTADVKAPINNLSGNGWKVFDPVTGKDIYSSSGETWNEDNLKNGIIYKVPPNTLGMLVIKK